MTGRLIILLLLGLALIGCSHVNYRTAWKLRKLDIRTLDPHHVKVRLVHSPKVRIREGDVKLVVNGINKVTGEKLNETYTLTRLADSKGSIWYFNKDTAQKIEKVRAKIIAWKQKYGKDVSGKISLPFRFCLLQALDAKDRYSLYVKPTAEQDFMPLIENKKLLDAMPYLIPEAKRKKIKQMDKAWACKTP